MNCIEIQEKVCDAVDHRLQQDELAALSIHLHRCPPCHIEYREIHIAKSIIQKKLRHMAVPEHVSSSILRMTLQDSIQDSVS